MSINVINYSVVKSYFQRRHTFDYSLMTNLYQPIGRVSLMRSYYGMASGAEQVQPKLLVVPPGNYRGLKVEFSRQDGRGDLK
jgi:hypothetical protein